MPQHWDPSDVLDLYNDHQCVGHAYSKGHKCTLRVNQRNVQRMDSIIAQIAQRRPDVDILHASLVQLAKCGLCLRYHQYQVDEMVEKWNKRIRAAFPPNRSAPQQPRARRASPAKIRVVVEAASRYDQSYASVGGSYNPPRARPASLARSRVIVEAASRQAIPPVAPRSARPPTVGVGRAPAAPALAPAPAPAPQVRRCAYLHVRRLPVNNEEFLTCLDDMTTHRPSDL